jgi:hypothetical protein
MDFELNVVFMAFIRTSDLKSFDKKDETPMVFSLSFFLITPFTNTSFTHFISIVL